MAKTLIEYKIGVGNLALQQNFEITFSHLPGSDKARLFSLLATGISIPDSEIIPVDVYWRGRHGEMPAALRTEGDITIPINIDNNMELYNGLYKARNLVADDITGLVRSWALVTFVMSVKALNPQLVDKVVGTWKFLDCTVKSLGGLDYKHQSQADKVEVPVVIHFDNFIYDHSGGLF